MEHSDSESDFELQAVDPGLADLSDERFETSLDICSSEKHAPDFFMFRLLGRLKGGTNFGRLLNRARGVLNMGGVLNMVGY